MTATFGYTIFYVDNVDATLTFFTEAFGIERRFLGPDKDYGELVTGDTTLSFASSELGDTNFAGVGGFTHLSADTPPVGASITLLVEDVAAGVASAVAAGAVQYTDITDKPWGQTVAYVRDANGILIEIATPVAN